MTLHVDTNIFLGFYQTNHDPISRLDDLVKCADNLVLVRQVVDEFYRNRNQILSGLLDEFQKKKLLPPYSVSVLRDEPVFKELLAKKDQYQELFKKSAERINRFIKEPGTDPVYVRFKDLVSACTVIDSTDEVVEKAWKRKLVGNPPRSEDKDTIGDEVIWETLLSTCNDDLVFVTKDGGYLKSDDFLAEDYFKRTGKKLVLLQKLSEGIQAIGKQPSPASIEADEKDAAETMVSDDWHTIRMEGDLAIVQRGEMVGRRPLLDGHWIDYSWRCGNCGKVGPWRGSQCLSCGVFSYPD